MKKEKITIVVTGVLIGVISAMLVFFGNPANMGFCIACFLRDTTGALGLHSAAAVQYIRPEIMAGAWCMHRVTDYKGISSERWFGTGYQIYTGSFCYDRMSDVPWVSVPNDPASGWW